MESHLLRAAVLLTLLLGACQGGSKPSTGIEPRTLDPRDVEVLDRLSRLWVASPAEYRSEKLQLLMQEPELAPWLVKSLTAEAVKAYDHLVAQGVVVHDLMRTEQGKDSFLGRTRAELATFGEVGLESVFTYLLRDERAQLREVGKLMLGGFPADELYPAFEAEWAADNPRSRRAILEVCAARAEDPRSLALIERAVHASSWQLRGAAQRPWARAAKAQAIPDAGQRLWDRFEDEADAFVRRQVILALGDLGDTAWLRPLVTLLERLEGEGRDEEARACVAALEAMTRERPGLRAADWKRWLEG